MTRNVLRQGDILLIRTESAPAEFERRAPGKAIVGYGEATGHHHVLEMAQWVVAPGTTDDDLRRFAQGERHMPVFVVATEPTTLTHPEHDALTVAPGVWRVIRQTQHVPGDLPRAVLD